MKFDVKSYNYNWGVIFFWRARNLGWFSHFCLIKEIGGEKRMTWFGNLKMENKINDRNENP